VSAAVTSQTEDSGQPPGAAHPAQRWGTQYGLCYEAGRWWVIYQRLDGVWCVGAIHTQRDEAEAQLDAITGRAGRSKAPRSARPVVPMAGQLSIDDILGEP
jgi:hypothetical protein